MAKVSITAMVTFEADTDDADQDLVIADQIHDLAKLELMGKCELEEVVSWERAS